MYGVVLMVAMTSGAETPALFNRNKGCSGCCGTVATSGCSGCSGRKGLFGKKHKGCKGCSGCSGYVACCGAPAVSCYGGCYGAPVVSCYGAPAVGCYGAPAVGCGGAPMVTYPPVAPVQPIVPMPTDKGKDGGKGKKGVEPLKKPPVDNEIDETTSARITITVPSDARVSINGTVTATTDTTRTFEFPGLESGKAVSYTFQAEFVRDGQNVVVTREVQVKAGISLEVSLENNAVASR